MLLMTQPKPMFEHDLEKQITCPYCWNKFAPEETYWISEHPEVQPDPLLGNVDEKLRFLPSRFDLVGNALDERGATCQELACPRCHLLVPRACFEVKPFFTSIVGTPSSGKSYFLSALTWQMRKILPRYLELSFADADPKLNKIINEYERLQFFNPDKEKYVKIEKTEEEGDLYSTVRYSEENVVTYPSPFFFTVRPTGQHPQSARGRSMSRLVTLYDNAGESFDPGKDIATNQVTRHLAMANAIFFLYDPTQDPMFRDACSAVSDDPQVCNSKAMRDDRQEIIFNNMTTLIRKHAGLKSTQKHDCPIVVIVTKFDVWKPLITDKNLPEPYIANPETSIKHLHTGLVERVSDKVRNLLLQYSPDVVSAAESFTDRVVYVPVSATGVSPKFDEERAELGIRPVDMQPVWAEVPLVYALAKWSDGIVGTFSQSEDVT
jgi:hypothetical protein